MAQHNTSAKREPPAWARENGWDSDVILSTRARLARNVAGVPFPGRASNDHLKKVVSLVQIAIRTPVKGIGTLRAVDVSKLDAPDRATLIDAHLISVPLATAGGWRWALVDDRHTISVMVNEEDHLRIQAILPGFQLMASWQIADHLDDVLASHIPYAKHPQYGYLTSSLSNCGTGLRISVMAHLPGLELANRLEDTLIAAETLGVTVRGMFGENTGAPGAIFQISNGITLGMTENQIIARLSAVTAYIVTEELSVREILWRSEQNLIENVVADANNRLKAAHRLNAADALRILSHLRLGQKYGLETGITDKVFVELLATMRIGAQFIVGRKAHYTFYEENRRPAIIRNKIREYRRLNNKDR